MMLIAAALAYYRSLPNWAQLAVQWAIRAAIASFILAQWSSVATYWYAMRYGARPPVEGVPFLALTVGLLGLALGLITIVLFYGLPLILRLVRLIARFSIKILTLKVSMSLLEAFERLLASLIILAILVLVMFIAFDNDIPIKYRAIETKNDDTSYFTYYVFIFILSFVLVIIGDLSEALHDRNIVRISFALYAVATITLMVAILGKPFDHILRATKFGGGVKVEVELADKERLVGQSLFITSANFVTVYDPATKEFRELNRNHIVQIKYRGINGWSLPREKEYSEIVGFDDVAVHEGTSTGSTGDKAADQSAPGSAQP